MANIESVETFYNQKKEKQQDYRADFYEDLENIKETNKSNVEYLKVTRDYGHK
jgi:hypothetical protein